MAIGHKKTQSAEQQQVANKTLATHQKTYKVKHHHAKPYRKRHVSALFLFIIVSSVLITWIVIYRQETLNRMDGAQSYLSEIFNPATTTQQTVLSTYGYSLQYDARSFNGSAIDSASGDLFSGQELSTNRAYQTVRVATGGSGSSKNTQRSFTINYYDTQPVSSLTDQALFQLERKVAATGVDANGATIGEVSSTTQVFDAVAFRVTEWKVTFTGSALTAKTPVQLRTYAGVVHGKAMVMKLTYGFGNTNTDALRSIIHSLKFTVPRQSALPVSKQVQDKLSHSETLLNTVLMTKIASAATMVPADYSEQISSRYSPAVVKIYNVYCMDISIDNVVIDLNSCDGGTGSGFFIDGVGTIATNGHVASADPLDIAIKDAVANLVNGDDSFFVYLAKLAGLTNADFTGKETSNEIANIAVNKMYTIDKSRVTTSNSVTNLLVGLNEKQPNINELIADTKNRKEYPEQDSIKKARLIAKDFRVIDGITSFKASDVALIKIDGNNYPVAKLGSISGVSQGANLMILGFPGGASNNGIVDSTVSKPTLTAGKVSSIKTVSGSTKKLIETDATIGHGNSGGPVFDSIGNVVGIATYTIDGSGSGDGTYNYIRDIQDLKDLASNNYVTVNGTSDSQTEWNKGIDLFYMAHYSKANKRFALVKKLYPQNPKVDELMDTADERIRNGQDVKDFPYIIVGAAVIAMIGAAGSAFAIWHHHRAHKVYVGRLTRGKIHSLQAA